MAYACACTLLCCILSLAGVSCGDNCRFSCPLGDFLVVVPTDRVSDVTGVTPSGPCRPELVTGFPAGEYFIQVDGIGVCHVTVSFRSGAPDFVTDVKMNPGPGPCCAGEATPETSMVAVPESGPADAATDN